LWQNIAEATKAGILTIKEGIIISFNKAVANHFNIEPEVKNYEEFVSQVKI
jgi:hypothetical protein